MSTTQCEPLDLSNFNAVKPKKPRMTAKVIRQRENDAYEEGRHLGRTEGYRDAVKTLETQHVRTFAIGMIGGIVTCLCWSWMFSVARAGFHAAQSLFA